MSTMRVVNTINGCSCNWNIPDPDFSTSTQCCLVWGRHVQQVRSTRGFPMDNSLQLLRNIVTVTCNIDELLQPWFSPVHWAGSLCTHRATFTSRLKIVYGAFQACIHSVSIWLVALTSSPWNGMANCVFCVRHTWVRQLPTYWWLNVCDFLSEGPQY